MKNIFALAFFLLLLTSSCKDPCKDINCNNGICLEGTCLCDDGYEGINCDQLERQKFIGSWTGPLNCGILGENEATIIVSPNPSSDQELLFSLDTDLTNLEALSGTVSGDIFFISPSMQTIEVPMLGETEATLSGDGTLNEDGTVTTKINIVTLIGALECTGTLVKQ